MTTRARLRRVEDLETHDLDAAAKEALRNRLARLEGHARAGRGMLEEGRCPLRKQS